MASMGKLSIVATPIGNLKDITLRALKILSVADVIVCEDTRVTKKLLGAHAIHKPLLSYHARSKKSKSEEIEELLRHGKHLALVTDAGTPGISDPGGELVEAVRKELGEAVTIEAIPGPSALSAALSVAGVRAAAFVFYGFLPHKKGRETLLKAIAADDKASVFFESTHRLMKTLLWCAENMPQRRLALCKELTKMFEKVCVGTAGEMKEQFSKNPDLQKGEFVIIVEER